MQPADTEDRAKDGCFTDLRLESAELQIIVEAGDVAIVPLVALKSNLSTLVHVAKGC